MISTITTSVTAAQAMTYSIIAVIALVAFIAFKEILSSEAGKNKWMQSFIEGSNIAIVPLLMVFLSIVAYKVMAVI